MQQAQDNSIVVIAALHYNTHEIANNCLTFYTTTHVRSLYSNQSPVNFPQSISYKQKAFDKSTQVTITALPKITRKTALHWTVTSPCILHAYKHILSIIIFTTFSHNQVYTQHCALVLDRYQCSWQDVLCVWRENYM